MKARKFYPTQVARHLGAVVTAAPNSTLSAVARYFAKHEHALGVSVIVLDQTEMLKQRFGSHDCAPSIFANPNIKIAFKFAPAPSAASVQKRI